MPLLLPLLDSINDAHGRVDDCSPEKLELLELDSAQPAPRSRCVPLLNESVHDAVQGVKLLHLGDEEFGSASSNLSNMGDQSLG